MSTVLMNQFDSLSIILRLEKLRIRKAKEELYSQNRLVQSPIPVRPVLYFYISASLRLFSFLIDCKAPQEARRDRLFEKG